MSDVKRVLGPTEQLLAIVVGALPSVGLAVLVLFVGLAVSVIVRGAATTAASRLGLDALAERFGVARLLYGLQIRGGVGAVLANLLTVVIALVTISMAAEIVGLPGVAEGVGAVLEFLPRLVSAGVVALFGFAAAEVASRVAEGLGRRRRDIVAPKFAANIAYYLVLAVVSTTAVQHLGMETDLIDTLIAVVTAAVLGSMALSFAWASRLLLQDVLARPYVLHQLEKGAVLRVGSVMGTVEATNTLTIVLRTEAGDLHVLPYRRLLGEEGFTMVAE